MDRPPWDQYFMGIAHHASLRSHDAETKVGCVIVNDDKHVLSMGYNGFPSGCEDNKLPSTRPDKYPFMVHAEQNAISNIVVKSCESLTAYITHRPCCVCAKLLWQNNVRRWFVEEGFDAKSFSDNDRIVHEFLIDNGLNFDIIKTDAEPFRSVYNKLTSTSTSRFI